MCTSTQDRPLRCDTLITVLEGSKLVALLPDYDPEGIPAVGCTLSKADRSRLTSAVIAPACDTIRAFELAGYGRVHHVSQFQSIIVPKGMIHAAVNLERSVSINSSLIPVSQVIPVCIDTFAYIHRQMHEDSQEFRGLGSGFAQFVRKAVSLENNQLCDIISVMEAEDVREQSCELRLGRLSRLKAYIAESVNVGNSQSGMNEKWRKEMCVQIQAVIDGLAGSMVM